jgi:hypothetical protein
VELEGEALYAIAGTWVVEDMPATTKLITARAVVSPKGTKCIQLRVLYPFADAVTLYKLTRVAKLEPVEECICYITSATHQHLTRG